MYRPFFIFSMKPKKARQYGLTDRERTCVLVSAFYATQNRIDAVRLLSKSKKLDKRLLVELFFHLSLLLGFPTMLDGLEKLAVRKLLPRNARRKRQTQGLQKKGMDVLKHVYGDQASKLLTSLRRIHPDLPDMIVQDVYGKVIARSGMTLRERELVNITVLTIQGLERQLYSHVRGALRVGVPAGVLRSLLLLLGRRFSVPVHSARQFLAELAR